MFGFQRGGGKKRAKYTPFFGFDWPSGVKGEDGYLHIVDDDDNNAGALVYYKIINGKPRECHNKKAQSIPSTKRKRNLPKTETTKLHVNNSRKTSSLFPNRGS